MTLRPPLFNFGCYGSPLWYEIDAWTMAQAWQGAEYLCDSYAAPVCDSMILDSEQSLVSWCEQGHEPDDHWISLALVITAMRAIREGEIPEIWFPD